MRIEIGTNEKLNFPKFVHALSAYDSAINRTLLVVHRSHRKKIRIRKISRKVPGSAKPQPKTINTA